MNRVVCIGELIVDFFTIETDVSLSAAELFVKKAGGAPANVCAAIARLGGDARFCGKVGQDSFGYYLEKTLVSFGVDTRYLMKSELPTTLAFVTRQQGGERDFVFQRGADQDVSAADFGQFQFEEEVAHFGSATALLDEPFRGAYIGLMRTLRERGTFISFDPNFRAALWAGREGEFIEGIRRCVSFADFVKMSEEEYEMFEEALNAEGQSVSDVSSAIFAVTLGERGTRLIVSQEEHVIPSIQIESIDSTGAGDAFVGGLLYQLAGDQFVNVRDAIINNRSMSSSWLQSILEMVKVANIVGALTCTKIGAMEAIPSIEVVNYYKSN